MKQDDKKAIQEPTISGLGLEAVRSTLHLPAADWAFPAVGLAVGLGLGFVESVLVLRPMLESFGGEGVLALYLPVLFAYSLFGSAIDLFLQRVWLARGLDAPAWVVGGAVLGVIAFFGLYIGLPPFVLGGAMCFVMLWAWVALKLRWLGAASLAWAVIPMAQGSKGQMVPPTEAIGQGGDIVLVVFDAFRWDHSSAYGYERATTPHMEALAAQGERFERAYAAAPWTLPSHVSLFTGRMPAEHGAHNEHMRFDLSWPTLAESLGEAGYETVGFSASPFTGHGPGTARGFQGFSDYWRAFTIQESTFGWRIWTRLLAPDRDKGGRQIVRDLEAYLGGRTSERPLFLFINLMETHAPYQAVPLDDRGAFSAESVSRLEQAGVACELAQVFNTSVDDEDRSVCIDLLDGAYRAADTLLGEILALVPEDGLVVVTAGHGDELGEQGRYGHSTGLRETVLRVPLILAGPGVSAGSSEPLPVSLLDIAPTLLTYAGLEPRGLPGRDLLAPTDAAPLVRAEHWRTEFTTAGWRLANPNREYPVEQGRAAAVIGERFKRVVGETGLDQGFDLVSDPQEKLPFTGSATDLPLWLPAVDE